MTAAVLTPFSTASAVELGNRLWRKRVLPVGEVEYKGRMLRFTRDYLGGLVAAFQDQAYDQVPFQLADAQNTHTNDPERTRGWVKGMELGDDGLYVTAEVNEAGEQVLTANPNLGVSARIVEDYARSDGRHFSKAIQHVLGTLDPRIPGLGAWEAIEAANPLPDRVIDLSGSSFSGGEPTPDGSPPDPVPGLHQQIRTDGMADLSALTDGQQQKLLKLLEVPDEQLDQLAAGGLVLTPEELEALTVPDSDEDEDDEDPLVAEIAGMTEDEIAALEAEYEAENAGAGVLEGEPVAAGLSAEAQFSIDLANARADETARELSVIQARLREEDFLSEKRRMADLGVPPYLTELARPLLEGAGHAVELANGSTVDAGAIMRRVLSEYARQVKLLDLDVELGSPMDEPEGAGGEEAEQSRASIVARMKSATGLK